MKKIILSVALAAFFAAPALAQDHSQHATTSQTSDMSAASQAYMGAMAKMDADMKAMTMTGKPGADFALMMIPHHQSAIDMAKAYLASGENDAELTKLSQDVVAAQEKEIAFLKAWLKKNGQ
jgi:uncharacterized protein (DUF305 family)